MNLGSGYGGGRPAPSWHQDRWPRVFDPNDGLLNPRDENGQFVPGITPTTTGHSICEDHDVRLGNGGAQISSDAPLVTTDTFALHFYYLELAGCLP
jgi:hypothetical protein